MMPTRVAVAMSGGVDSSVAAARLLGQRYDVFGVTMQLWPCTGDDPMRANTCCGAASLERARAVAGALGIPHYVVNYEAAFEAEVIDDFCAEYGRGRTPNPCVRCNTYLKFDRLLKKVREMGADLMATGHYARIGGAAADYSLLRARDAAKDQTYFLYTLGQPELAQLLFPVGEMTKPEVRVLAAELNLPASAAPESQDICFAVGSDYHSFISARLELVPGEIVDTAGKLLGRHRGLPLYTVGQRQGLGIAAAERLYVVALDAAANRLVVGVEPELLNDCLVAADLAWVSGGPPEPGTGVTARIRYRAPDTPVTLAVADGRASVRFASSQRAVAPGQAVVFYAGDRVLGGGIIESAGSAGECQHANTSG
jgi:tRNA-uridine 2-sulfurtransferase